VGRADSCAAGGGGVIPQTARHSPLFLCAGARADAGTCRLCRRLVLTSTRPVGGPAAGDPGRAALLGGVL